MGSEHRLRRGLEGAPATLRTMESTHHDADPEIESGFTLANFGEIIFPCLDAIAPESVLEVGSYEGDFTAALLQRHRYIQAFNVHRTVPGDQRAAVERELQRIRPGTVFTELQAQGLQPPDRVRGGVEVGEDAQDTGTGLLHRRSNSL